MKNDIDNYITEMKVVCDCSKFTHAILLGHNNYILNNTVEKNENTCQKIRQWNYNENWNYSYEVFI